MSDAILLPAPECQTSERDAVVAGLPTEPPRPTARSPRTVAQL